MFCRNLTSPKTLLRNWRIFFSADRQTLIDFWYSAIQSQRCRLFSSVYIFNIQRRASCHLQQKELLTWFKIHDLCDAFKLKGLPCGDKSGHRTRQRETGHHQDNSDTAPHSWSCPALDSCIWTELQSTRDALDFLPGAYTTSEVETLFKNKKSIHCCSYFSKYWKYISLLLSILLIWLLLSFIIKHLAWFCTIFSIISTRGCPEYPFLSFGGNQQRIFKAGARMGPVHS